MCECHDVDNIGDDCIDDREWEPWKNDVAQIFVQSRSELRVIEYEFDDPFHFFREACTEAWYFCLIAQCGFIQFLLRF